LAPARCRRGNTGASTVFFRHRRPSPRPQESRPPGIPRARHACSRQQACHPPESRNPGIPEPRNPGTPEPRNAAPRTPGESGQRWRRHLRRREGGGGSDRALTAAERGTSPAPGSVREREGRWGDRSTDRSGQRSVAHRGHSRTDGGSTVAPASTVRVRHSRATRGGRSPSPRSAGRTHRGPPSPPRRRPRAGGSRASAAPRPRRPPPPSDPPSPPPRA
jgi:hypothetical protein